MPTEVLTDDIDEMVTDSDNDTVTTAIKETIKNSTEKFTQSTDSVGDFLFNLAIILFQLVAFAFILVPRSIKVSLKIFLMSLTLPGFLQNSSWAALRVATIWFRGPLVANEVGCTLLLIVTHLANLSSQTSIASITINNYIAVTHPIQFKRWVTPCKTCLAIVGIWCLWAIITISDTITRVDSRKPCLPMVVSSYFMLLTIALVILITTITVSCLNVKLAIQFWGKFKVYPVNPADITTNAEKQMSYLSPDAKISEMPSSSSVFSIDDFTQSQAPSVIMLSTKKICDISHPEHSRKGIPPIFSLQLPDNSSSAIVPDSRSKLSGKQVRFESSSMGTTSAKPRQKNKISHQRKRQLRDRNLAITLIMLTIWNSLGFLPYMVLLLLSVSQRGSGVSGNLRPLSDAAGIVVRLSNIGNTFIYAWRFIKWRSVCSSLKSRLVTCQRSTTR